MSVGPLLIGIVSTVILLYIVTRLAGVADSIEPDEEEQLTAATRADDRATACLGTDIPGEGRVLPDGVARHAGGLGKLDLGDVP